MQFLNKAKSIVSDVALDLTKHWKKPQKGNYVSYKEITNYSVGGMGVNLIAFVAGYMGFGAANTLLGSTIGIRPMHLQYMATVMSVINVFMYIIRGYMVDNTRTKMGRFRPYLAFMGIPIVVLSLIFVFLPFEYMSYMKKLICVFGFGVAIAICLPLITDTYSELNSVISPNSAERTKIITISSLIYSFAPTVYGFFIPILSDLTGGYTKIETYRYVIAPLGILGMLLVMFVAFGSKERVVSSKSYVQKVGIIEGCLAIYKNKYWWIRHIAGIIGFLEGAGLVLFGWIYIYGEQNMVTFAILTTVLGTASGIAMAITPYFLKKLGNRRLMIYHNTLNIVFMVITMLIFKNPILYFLLLYMNTVVNQLAIVYNPSIHAEVKDYTQYVSGKRMDFMMGTAGLITMPLTILLGYFVPYIYESMGLTSNYDILYDPIVRNSLFYILCLLSIVGAALNLIPFFFYKLSREKHKQIIWVLKYRMAQDDFANGGIQNLSDSLICEVVDGYNFIHQTKALKLPTLKEAKMELLLAKKLPKSSIDEKQIRNSAIDNCRRNIKTIMAHIEDKAGVDEFSYIELEKFEQESTLLKLKFSRELASVDLNELKNRNLSFLNSENPSDTSLTKITEKFNKSVQKMSQKIQKHYVGAIDNSLAERLHLSLQMVESTKEERNLKNAMIKKTEKAILKFNRILKPYMDAKKLINQYEHRNFITDLMTAYPIATERIAAQDAKDLLSEVERDAERKEMLRLAREERFNKMTPKKQEKILEKRKEKQNKENK